MAAKKTSESHASADAPAPADLMRDSVHGLFDAAMKRASHSVVGKIESTTKNLVQRAADADALPAGAKDLADGKPVKAMASAGFSKAKDKVKDAVQGLTGGKGGKGGRGKLKITNIVETADVGVPIDVAYNQWTQFSDFPSFMKKVEHVEQESEEKATWKAQIFWSHRSWESEIVEQVPDERIVWTSKGQKGHVDGAVTFHELAPSLTRIVIVLVYHPQGLFEHVGNMWRAQGRRARLELKHFQRHVMTDAILHADELEGWRGEIHDGEVTPPEDVEEPDDRDSEDRDEDEPDDVEPDDMDDSEDAEDAEDEDDSEDAEDDDTDDDDNRAERRRSGRGGRSRDAKGRYIADDGDGDDTDSEDADSADRADDDEEPERRRRQSGRDEARQDRRPRRRSDDDEQDQGRRASKRQQQRPARNRGGRAAERAGVS